MNISIIMEIGPNFSKIMEKCGNIGFAKEGV